jgi:hypothetical protein
MERYVGMTQTALAGDPDLVIWPEAAVPRPLLLDEIIFGQVKELASKTHADFLIGSVQYEQEPRGDYNSAILLADHAGQAKTLTKVKLGEQPGLKQCDAGIGGFVGLARNELVGPQALFVLFRKTLAINAMIATARGLGFGKAGEGEGAVVQSLAGTGQRQSERENAGFEALGLAGLASAGRAGLPRFAAREECHRAMPCISYESAFKI